MPRMADDSDQIPKTSRELEQLLENETDPQRIVALTRQLIDALDEEENKG
jgi:hypothetical protein